jgi:hypothetical protein
VLGAKATHSLSIFCRRMTLGAGVSGGFEKANNMTEPSSSKVLVSVSYEFCATGNPRSKREYGYLYRIIVL